MPAYHSQFNDATEYRSLGNMALLPLKTKVRGPSPLENDPEAEDIIDEAINLFRANCFFRNFEIKGNADRVLIYLTLFISECLNKLSKNPSQIEANKLLQNLATDNFAIPGDAAFPINSMYAAPSNKQEADILRQYIQQLRQELASRLVQRVYLDGKPSKWWMCFQKRKFMNLSL